MIPDPQFTIHDSRCVIRSYRSKMNVKHSISIGGLLFFWVVGACHPRMVGASGEASSAKERRPYNRFVSEKGRFSIEFTREPTYDVQEFGPTVIHEFKVDDERTEWRVTYTDFQTEVNDEDSVRAAYRKAIESLRKRPATLITQTDIRLKGRLGVKDLLREGGVVYSTRSFLIGRRLYLISVKENRDTKQAARAAISPKVRRFLDSFDFWEINNLQLSAN